MKSFLVYAFSLLGVFLKSNKNIENTIEEDEKIWSNFKKNYGKAYNDQDEPVRRQLFLARRAKYDEFNKRFEKGQTSYYTGLNRFSDMVKFGFVFL